MNNLRETSVSKRLRLLPIEAWRTFVPSSPASGHEHPRYRFWVELACGASLDWIISLRNLNGALH